MMFNKNLEEIRPYSVLTLTQTLGTVQENVLDPIILIILKIDMAVFHKSALQRIGIYEPRS